MNPSILTRIHSEPTGDADLPASNSPTDITPKVDTAFKPGFVGYEPQGVAKSTGRRPHEYTSLFHEDTKPRGNRRGDATKSSLSKRFGLTSSNNEIPSDKTRQRFHTKDSLKEAQAQALRLLRTSSGGRRKSRRKFRRQSRRTRLHKRKTRRH